MAKTSASIDVPVSQDRAFAAVTDLSGFGDWLVFHDGWRGAVPAQAGLGKGTRVSTVVDVKGAKLPIDWKVDVHKPPREFRFSGKEKGVKVTVAFSVEGSGDGSTVTFVLELSGLPVVGPIGKAVVKQVHDDVAGSLERLRGVLA